MNEEKHTNLLIHEISPYLLQHAYNPVYWYPWGKEALNRATNENKPILVSIGYSSCHWCHVMAHESFEDETVARIMNDHFICIKVDREERPDIDQIYMEAVQMLTGQGGWPLNCFALPDGRPFYGGTYFTKEQWIEVLLGISGVFNGQAEKVLQQADLIAREIINNQKIISDTVPEKFPDTAEVYQKLADNFDLQQGGIGVAPKFPMPVIYEFLLAYYYFSGNEQALDHSIFTLEKMIFGGIFDQIGGGFARYSTDENWFAPHFEKMLYDNAQLVRLLSHAFQITQKESFRKVIQRTVEFLENEMMNTNGGFYSAIDADSEGKEGKFYTWTYAELNSILEDDAKLICDYFGVVPGGNWEENSNILAVKQPVGDLAMKYQLPLEKVDEMIEAARLKLLQARSKRVGPAMDTKFIASWNGLMIRALITAYKATQVSHYLDMALNCSHFIVKNMLQEGKLLHYYPAKREICGFLDDYATIIAAFMELYEQTTDFAWLTLSQELLNYSLDHFFDRESGLFFYESDEQLTLIVRKIELIDNVIPSANSLMADNLLRAASYFSKTQYKEIVIRMFSQVSKHIIQHPAYYANWARILLLLQNESKELIIAGKKAREYLCKFSGNFIPNVLLAVTESPSEEFIFKNRYIEDKTLFYVCKNNVCDLPVENYDEAIELLHTK